MEQLRKFQNIRDTNSGIENSKIFEGYEINEEKLLKRCMNFYAINSKVIPKLSSLVESRSTVESTFSENKKKIRKDKLIKQLENFTAKLRFEVKRSFAFLSQRNKKEFEIKVGEMSKLFGRVFEGLLINRRVYPYFDRVMMMNVMVNVLDKNTFPFTPQEYKAMVKASIPEDSRRLPDVCFSTEFIQYDHIYLAKVDCGKFLFENSYDPQKYRDIADKIALFFLQVLKLDDRRPNTSVFGYQMLRYFTFYGLSTGKTKNLTLYFGTNRSDLAPFYDMLTLLDFCRINSHLEIPTDQEPEPYTIDMYYNKTELAKCSIEGAVSLVITYLTLIFSEIMTLKGNLSLSSMEFNYGNKLVSPVNIIVTEDFERRTQNIREYSELLDKAVAYCEKSLDINTDLHVVEEELRVFKKEVLLDPYADIHIYEIDPEELMSYLSSQQAYFDDIQPAQLNKFLYYTFLNLDNFLLQMIISMDIIWFMQPRDFNRVSSIKITPFFNNLEDMNHVHAESLVFIIQILYVDSVVRKRESLNISFKRCKNIVPIGNTQSLTRKIHLQEESIELIKKVNYSLHKTYLDINLDKKDNNRTKNPRVAIKIASVVGKLKLMAKKKIMARRLKEKLERLKQQDEEANKNKLKKSVEQTRKEQIERFRRAFIKQGKDIEEIRNFEAGERMGGSMAAGHKDFNRQMTNKDVTSSQAANIATRTFLNAFGRAELMRTSKNISKKLTDFFESGILEGKEELEADLDEDENVLKNVEDIQRMHDTIDQSSTLSKLFFQDRIEYSKRDLQITDDSKKYAKVKGKIIQKKEESNKSIYDTSFFEFRKNMQSLLRVDSVAHRALKETRDLRFMGFNKAREIIIKKLGEDFMLPEEVNECIKDIQASINEVYFRIYPTIFRYKKIGRLKEEEMLEVTNTSSKLEDVSWEFRKELLDKKFKTKIMNFQGKHNIIFEKIFEILSTNTSIVSSIILMNDELARSSKIMRIFFSYFGGFNLEYRHNIGVTLLEKTASSYLDYFFEIYIPKLKKSYETDLEEWYQFVRKSRFDHPQVHLFLNSVRWTLDNLEMKKYALQAIEKMSRVYVNSKVSYGGNELQRMQMDKKRIEAGFSSRYLLGLKVLENLCDALHWTEVTTYVDENKYLKEFLDEIMSVCINYIVRKNFDQRNRALFMIHIVINGVILPQCARICRSLLFEKDLSQKFMYLTKDWLDPPYEISHLETQTRTLALYYEMMDVFNSILPSILITMFDSDSTSQIDLLIEGSTSSYDKYKAKATMTQINWIQCSPYLDKMSLIPINDFDYLYKLLKRTNKQIKLKGWPSQQFANTQTLFKLLIDEIVMESEEIDSIITNLLKISLKDNADILILISTGINSLYNEANSQIFKKEFSYFLMINSNFIERYNDTIEKLAYQISENIHDEFEDDDLKDSPLLVNEKRKPCTFLLDSINFSNDFDDLINRFLDNIAIYFLWKKFDKSTFEINFAHLVAKVTNNNQYLKNSLESLRVYNSICKCLKKDSIFISDFMFNSNQDLEFVDTIYLKQFFVK